MRTTVIVALFSLTACTAPGPLPSQPTTRSVSVEATARIDVVPDTASVQLTFSALEHDLGIAHEAVEADRRRFLSAMDELDVEVETGATSYQPQHDREGEVTGYRASQTLHVATTNLDEIPTIIRRAGPRLHRVEVRHYSSDLVQYRTRLREMAIAAARTKAEELTEGFGAELGELITVHEGGATTAAWGVGNMIDNDRASAGGDDFTVPPPGSLPLQVTLQVTFGIAS